jgi:hypothetical protein
VIEFVFMLTHRDATVENAREVLDDVRGTGLRYIGFKDVGASPRLLRDVTELAHGAGLQVMLEIVSTGEADEIRSLRNATSIGVDWVLGGTHPHAGVEILGESGISYCPFPGIVEGHPSVLKGSRGQIAEHARELTATDGIHGVDLLAYRHEDVDPLALTRAVVEAAEGPVIVAGSIATLAQIESLEQAGAWGFTIGGAIFEARFPGGRSVADQVRTVLDAVDAAPA